MRSLNYKEPKFHIRYLERDALRKLTKYSNKPKYEQLDILARGLSFNNYEHILNSYLLNKSNGYFDKNFINKDALFKRDLSEGFYFSQFVLRSELEFKKQHEVYALKLTLDNHFRKKKPIRRDGNIVFTDSFLVKKGSEIFKPGNRKRLMGEYPFNFYTRQHPIKFKSTEGIIQKKELLYCDSFYPSNDHFFNNSQKSIADYGMKILSILLSANHVIINQDVLETLEGNYKNLFDRIQFEYNTIPLKWNSWNGKGGLFIHKCNWRLNRKSINPINEVDYSTLLSTNFGQLIRELRTDRNWSISHLSDLSGISERAISNLELEEVVNPKLETLIRIFETFRRN